MKKEIIILSIMSSFNVYALPDLSKEMEGEDNNQVDFVFSGYSGMYDIELKKKEEILFFNKKSLNDNGYENGFNDYYLTTEFDNYNYKSDYTIREATREVFAILSTHLFDKLLPDNWTISLEYDFIERFNSLNDDEKFILSIETKI